MLIHKDTMLAPGVLINQDLLLSRSGVELWEAKNGRKLHLVSALRVDSLAFFYIVRPLSHGRGNNYPQAGSQNLILTLPSLADGAGVSQGGLIKFIRDEGCCSEWSVQRRVCSSL